MDDVIKRDEASEIARKLGECRNHLQQCNIFSCLIHFREALEKMLSTKMLASDEKELNNDINLFQKNLSDSRIFRDVYGPVTFRDNDIATALDFMKQLVRIKEEETLALLERNEEKKTDIQETSSRAVEVHNLLKQIKILIEKGDYAIAQETIAGDEEIIDLLVEEYNVLGIRCRRDCRLDEAVSEFKKALVVQPHDEGLYYNIARVHIAREEWKSAAETIGEGLKINPDFGEGIKLLKYIRETAGIDV